MYPPQLSPPWCWPSSTLMLNRSGVRCHSRAPSCPHRVSRVGMNRGLYAPPTCHCSPNAPQRQWVISDSRFPVLSVSTRLMYPHLHTVPHPRCMLACSPVGFSPASLHTRPHLWQCPAWRCLRRTWRVLNRWLSCVSP